MRIIERRGWFFAISLILMLPGIIYMVWSLAARGTILPLSIDYTGGLDWEMRFPQAVVAEDVHQLFVNNGFEDTKVVTVGDDRTVQVKTKEITPEEKAILVDALNAQFGSFEEMSYRNIGPAIGSEVSRAAILAVTIASLLILFYLAYSFRSCPTRCATARAQ